MPGTPHCLWVLENVLKYALASALVMARRHLRLHVVFAWHRIQTNKAFTMRSPTSSIPRPEKWPLPLTGDDVDQWIELGDAQAFRCNAIDILNDIGAHPAFSILRESKDQNECQIIEGALQRHVTSDRYSKKGTERFHWMAIKISLELILT
ncbi:MAG: hypothetical protein AAF355_11130 [Myxococcota bacterium]